MSTFGATERHRTQKVPMLTDDWLLSQADQHFVFCGKISLYSFAVNFAQSEQ